MPTAVVYLPALSAVDVNIFDDQLHCVVDVAAATLVTRSSCTSGRRRKRHHAPEGFSTASATSSTSTRCICGTFDVSWCTLFRHLLVLILTQNIDEKRLGAKLGFQACCSSCVASRVRCCRHRYYRHISVVISTNWCGGGNSIMRSFEGNWWEKW